MSLYDEEEYRQGVSTYVNVYMHIHKGCRNNIPLGKYREIAQLYTNKKSQTQLGGKSRQVINWGIN